MALTDYIPPDPHVIPLSSYPINYLLCKFDKSERRALAAMFAMQGLLANSQVTFANTEKGAANAVAIADTLLAKLDEGKGG